MRTRHSDDPSGYRSKEEEELWRKNDPISRFRLWLVKQGWLDEEADKAKSDALRQEILDALKVAENSGQAWYRASDE